MILPTIETFRRALLAPDCSMRTLHGLKVRTTADGMPQLTRTSRFAEAAATLGAGTVTVAMPLTTAALPAVERIAAATGRITSPWIVRVRILRGELLWQGPTGAPCSCDLLVEELPDGCSFEEALRTVPAQQLRAALGALRAELRRLGLAHRNLKPATLRWSGGRLVPVRWYDAAAGADDDEAFALLERRIERASEAAMCVSDTAAEYAAPRRFDGHLWVGNLFEGLVCVEDETGYGYVDAENRPVIESRFCWAGDFREGRAEVELPGGMGLIDRTGRYVIPPCQEIVDYDPVRSVVRVRSGGLWALYDITGERLTPFGTEIETT